MCQYQPLPERCRFWIFILMSQNDLLHADSGLFLHPATKFGFIIAAWNIPSYLSWKCDHVRYSSVASADLIVLNTCQHILILWVTSYHTLILHHSLLPVTRVQRCLISIDLTKCHLQNTIVSQSVCHITSATESIVGFSWNSLRHFFNKSCPATVRSVKTVPVTVTLLP